MIITLEEPLPAGGSCLLGSLNLSEFVKEGLFDFTSFRSAINIAVRGLNKVLDEGLLKHPLVEQQNSVRNWRQIGLGITGLADCLIKLKIKYGKDAVPFVRDLGRVLINEALISSAILAKEEGCYPNYNKSVLETDFFTSVALNSTIELVKKYGLRNSQLLTCAPTGSLSSLLNCSSSGEPLFATSYNRRTISLNNEERYYKVYPKIIKELIDNGYTEENLPQYIVTTGNIPYKERVALQGVLNYYIDASISSTVNLKETATIDDIANLYIEAWKNKCKGITVWRDNCNRQAILTISPKPKPTKKESSSKPIFDYIKPVSRKELGTTSGTTSCKKCACGTLYITCNHDVEGNLVEVFTHTSKGGICQANMNAVTRLISLNLRSGVCVDEIMDQIASINCPACTMCKAKGIKLDGMSCPDIISKTIKEALQYDPCASNTKPIKESQTTVQPMVIKEQKICPECGALLIAQGGCFNCTSCGFSFCG